MYVYLIRSDTGKYKIGRSRNTERRYKELLAASPEPLDLLYEAWFGPEFAKKVEIDLHHKYEYYNLHHEWFEMPARAEDALLQDLYILEEAARLISIAIETTVEDSMREPWEPSLCPERRG